MKNIRILFVFGILLLSGSILLLFHNCAPARLTQPNYPPVGQTVQLMPVLSDNPSKADGDYQNVLLYLVEGGQMIPSSQDAIIQMFDSADAEQPLHEFTVNELYQAYQTTNCSSQLAESMKHAFAGDVLICNGNIDLDRVKKFVYKAGDVVKTSTSYTVDYVKDDLDILAVTVDFH